MESRTLGWIVAGASVVAIGTGVYLYMRSKRSSSGLSGSTGLPDPDGEWTEAGYTLRSYRKENLPIGERVAILQDLLHRDMRGPALPKIRQLAMDITRHCEARDTECESRAIYNWMRKNIRYTGDIAPHKLGRSGPVEGVDLFQGAARTLFEFKAGDCDDFAIADCALALSVGVPCRFAITSTTATKGADDYSHIFPEHGVPATKPTRWVPADSTLPGGNRYGQTAPHKKALRFDA